MVWDPIAQLSETQRGQLEAFEQLLLRFNRQHNLISGGTERHIREQHTLHALTLTRRRFPDGSAVVDWGTGGGLPALPLAIAFPDVRFYAVDAVRKKIFAVRSMARRLGLENLEAWHGRADRWPGRAHYSVSRATAPLAALWRWHQRIRSDDEPARTAEHWQPGLLCLKGGDLTAERETLLQRDPAAHVEDLDLHDLLGRDFFQQKFLLHVYRPAAS